MIAWPNVATIRPANTYQGNKGIGTDFRAKSMYAVGFGECAEFCAIVLECTTRGHDDETMSSVMDGNFFR